MSKDKARYGAEQIQVLEGLEAVRKRPGMYIGSTSTRGLHHLVYEVVDNSIDEALAGYCTHIEVTIQEDNSITVVDNGRGIPVAMHKIGKPAVEVVLTVLHAGGKFGGDGYPISGGLHGVGISVVNALSVWTKVQVKRDGYLWDISFTRGVTDQPLRKVRPLEAGEETGTKVSFKPDHEIFPDTVYDFNTLKTRLRELAFLNKGLHITLTDEQDVPDALARLRVIYPNLMRLDYDNLRTREDQEITAPERAESITPLEHFSAFYQLQNNQPLTAEQAAFCQQLIEEIWKEGEDA